MAIRKIDFKDPEGLKDILRNEIQRSDEARYHHRLHAVLMAVGGRSSYDIAELLGDAPRSVYNWINHFQKEGLDGLREEMRPGRPRRLTNKQTKALAKDLVRCPADFGYGQPIWDGPLLSRHLEKAFGVSLGVRQCQRIFQDLGVRLLRPPTYPKGADSDKQAEFKKTDLLVSGSSNRDLRARRGSFPAAHQHRSYGLAADRSRRFHQPNPGAARSLRRS